MKRFLLSIFSATIIGWQLLSPTGARAENTAYTDFAALEANTSYVAAAQVPEEKLVQVHQLISEQVASEKAEAEKTEAEKVEAFIRTIPIARTGYVYGIQSHSVGAREYCGAVITRANANMTITTSDKRASLHYTSPIQRIDPLDWGTTERSGDRGVTFFIPIISSGDPNANTPMSVGEVIPEADMDVNACTSTLPEVWGARQDMLFSRGK